MDERRVDERVGVEVEVRYRTIQDFLAAYSRNISGGGLFVRTAQPQPLNQQVQLRFTLPGVVATAVGGVVVSKPIAKNTTSRSGCSRARRSASADE